MRNYLTEQVNFHSLHGHSPRNGFSFEGSVFHGTSIGKFAMKIVPLFAVLGTLFLAACQATQKQPPGSDYLAGLGGAVPSSPATLGVAEQVSYWDDDGSQGPAHVVVDLRRQVAQFYRGGRVIGVAAISSGKEGRHTPSGAYKVLQKDPTHKSAQYGWIEDTSGKMVNEDATPATPVPAGCRYVAAPMPWFMRLTNDGVGMHEGYLPGYPASHGCIRMDRGVVKHFYDNAYVGMPVEVIN
jgi:lipoprotein-anchoring transpeptidase ErfK/SrfK